MILPKLEKTDLELLELRERLKALYKGYKGVKELTKEESNISHNILTNCECLMRLVNILIEDKIVRRIDDKLNIHIGDKIKDINDN
jgi:hypothetical protein